MAVQPQTKVGSLAPPIAHAADNPLANPLAANLSRVLNRSAAQQTSKQPSPTPHPQFRHSVTYQIAT